MRTRCWWRQMMLYQESRHFPYADVGDRLLIAHLAIITFGLVAIGSTWQDSALSFSMVFGLKSLLVLAVNDLWMLYQRPLQVLQDVDWVCLIGIGVWFVAFQTLLTFIRRANLLAGPPCRRIAFFVSNEGQKPAQQVFAVRASAFSVAPTFYPSGGCL